MIIKFLDEAQLKKLLYEIQSFCFKKNKITSARD